MRDIWFVSKYWLRQMKWIGTSFTLFVWKYILFSLEWMQRGGMATLYDKCMFSLAKWLYNFTFPPAVFESLSFFLSMLGMMDLFGFSYFNRVEEIFCISLMNKVVEHIFGCLFASTYFLLFFITSFLEYNCYKRCVSFCCITRLISYMYTYIPISPPSCVSLPPFLSHPSRWSQSTELISLCYIAGSH